MVHSVMRGGKNGAKKPDKMKVPAMPKKQKETRSTKADGSRLMRGQNF